MCVAYAMCSNDLIWTLTSTMNNYRWNGDGNGIDDGDGDGDDEEKEEVRRMQTNGRFCA